MTTYKTVRHYSPGSDGKRPRTIDTGLTLDEAQEYCSRDDTHGGVDCSTCGLWSRGRKVVERITGKRCPACGSSCIRGWFDGYTQE